MNKTTSIKAPSPEARGRMLTTSALDAIRRNGGSAQPVEYTGVNPDGVTLLVPHQHAYYVTERVQTEYRYRTNLGALTTDGLRELHIVWNW